MSGDINTETASGVRSRTATENIVKIMDFPKPVGKTAKTSFPSSCLYKAFSCSPLKTIVFPLKSKNNNAFLNTSFIKSAMILECVTNSESTALYHGLTIVPLTNQKPRLLVDGIRPSLPAGGFSLPSPSPLPRFLLSPARTRERAPQKSKMAPDNRTERVSAMKHTQ